MNSRNDFVFLSMLLLLISAINGSDSRKLDETAVPRLTDNNCEPCGQTSPPPPPPPVPSLPPPSPSLPPPSPCPPPPSSSYPSPPSPKKKPPSGYYSPPPPFNYVTGPPGNLYPIDNDFSGVNGNLKVGLSVFIGWGLLGVLGFL